jgi:hypothetical protein
MAKNISTIVKIFFSHRKKIFHSQKKFLLVKKIFFFLKKFSKLKKCNDPSAGSPTETLLRLLLLLKDIVQ